MSAPGRSRRRWRRRTGVRRSRAPSCGRRDLTTSVEPIASSTNPTAATATQGRRLGRHVSRGIASAPRPGSASSGTEASRTVPASRSEARGPASGRAPIGRSGGPVRRSQSSVPVPSGRSAGARAAGRGHGPGGCAQSTPRCRAAGPHRSGPSRSPRPGRRPDVASRSGWSEGVDKPRFDVGQLRRRRRRGSRGVGPPRRAASPATGHHVEVALWLVESLTRSQCRQA